MESWEELERLSNWKSSVDVVPHSPANSQSPVHSSPRRDKQLAQIGRGAHRNSHNFSSRSLIKSHEYPLPSTTTERVVSRGRVTPVALQRRAMEKAAAAKEEQEKQNRLGHDNQPLAPIPKDEGKVWRDISYRKDRPGHGMTVRRRQFHDSHVPPSMIPKKHHIVVQSPIQPDDSDYHTEFKLEDRQWHTTIFPALRPSKREDVKLLDEWVNNVLSEELPTEIDIIEDEDRREDELIRTVERAQYVYSMAFHELVRQVYCHTVERGRLMKKVWKRYFEHTHRVLALLRGEKDRALRRLNEAHIKEIQNVHEEAEAKIQNNRDLMREKLREVGAEKDKLAMRLQISQKKLENRQIKIANLLEEKQFYESKISYILRKRNEAPDSPHFRVNATAQSAGPSPSASPRDTYGAQVDIVNGFLLPATPLGPDSQRAEEDNSRATQAEIDAVFEALQDKLKLKEEMEAQAALKKAEGELDSDQELDDVLAQEEEAIDADRDGNDDDDDNDPLGDAARNHFAPDYDPNGESDDDLGDYEAPPGLLDAHLRMDRLKDKLAFSHKYTKIGHINKINSGLMEIEDMVRALQYAELQDESQDLLGTSAASAKPSGMSLIDKTPVLSRMASWNDIASPSDTDSDAEPTVNVEELMKHFWDDAHDDLDEDGNPIEKPGAVHGTHSEGHNLGQAQDAPARASMPDLQFGPNMHVTEALRSKWKSVIDLMKSKAAEQNGETPESAESIRERTEALESLSAALESRVVPVPKSKDETVIGPHGFAESDLHETFATSDACTETDYYWAVDWPDNFIENPALFCYPNNAPRGMGAKLPLEVRARMLQRVRVNRPRTRSFDTTEGRLHRAQTIASTTDMSLLLRNIDKALFASQQSLEEGQGGDGPSSPTSPKDGEGDALSRSRTESAPDILGNSGAAYQPKQPSPLARGSGPVLARTSAGGSEPSVSGSSSSGEEDQMRPIGDIHGGVDMRGLRGQARRLQGEELADVVDVADDLSDEELTRRVGTPPRTSSRGGGRRGRPSSKGGSGGIQVTVDGPPTIQVTRQSPRPGQRADALERAELAYGSLVRLEPGHVTVSAQLLNQLRDAVVSKDNEGNDLRTEMGDLEEQVNELTEEVDRLQRLLSKVQDGAATDSEDETPRERSRAALSKRLGFKIKTSGKTNTHSVPKSVRRKTHKLKLSLVPAAFKKLLSKKMAQSRVQRSLKWTLKYISGILNEKIGVDIIDDRAGVGRQPLAEFVHDNHLNKYGLKQLAAKHIMDFLTALNLHRHSHPRVHLFARFAGMGGVDPLPLPMLDFYLHALACFRQSVEASSWKGNVFIRAVDAEEETCTVTVSQALDAFRHIYPLSRSNELSEYSSKLFAANVGASYKNTSRLDLDKLLDQMLKDHEDIRGRFEVPLSAIFRAADLDGDLVLDIPEFRRVMRYLTPDKSKKEIVKMYRLVLLDNPVLMGVNGLTQAMFERVVKQCGIHYWNVMPDKYFVGTIDLDMPSLDHVWEVRESALIKLATKTSEKSSRFETLKHLIVALQRDMDKREEPLVAWTRYKLLVTELYKSNNTKANYGGNYNPMKKKKEKDNLRRDFTKSSTTSLRNVKNVTSAANAFMSAGANAAASREASLPRRERTGGVGQVKSKPERRPSTLELLMRRPSKLGDSMSSLGPPQHSRRRSQRSRGNSPDRSSRSGDRSDRSGMSSMSRRSDTDLTTGASTSADESKIAISRTPSKILLSLTDD